MKNSRFAKTLAFAVLAFVLVAARPAHADGISLDVSIDTSALGNAAPSEIFFILTDGSGLGNANNTATFSNFAFGSGGSAGAVDTLNSFGGFSGTLAAGAALTDSAFTNIFAATFNSGSSLSFLLNLTTNLEPGGTPDFFSILLVDSQGNLLPSTDPSGAGNLLAVNLDSTTPTVGVYSSLVTATPASPGNPTPMPEPSSLALLIAAACAIFVAIGNSQFIRQPKLTTSR